jgi:hypothetical protein
MLTVEERASKVNR